MRVPRESFRPPGKANGLAPMHAGGEAADPGPLARTGSPSLPRGGLLGGPSPPRPACADRILVPAAGLSHGGTYTARDPLALRPAVTGGLPSGTELLGGAAKNTPYIGRAGRRST